MKKLFLFGALFPALILFGAEYFVTPADSLQQAVEKLQPGDILTLKKGVYRQGTVTITARGTAQKPIIIRGIDRDSTIVTAWRSLDNASWEPVKGERFVYRTPMKEEVFNVSDLKAEKLLLQAPAVHDMERYRGTFRHENGFLYVHTFDGKIPQNTLRATVHSGYLFLFQKAARIKVENLTFCGSAYKDPRSSSWAIAIRCTGTSDVSVENCSFLYNSGGVAFTVQSRNSTVRNCFFHRNDAPGYAEAAQLFFGGKSRNNLAENNLVINTGVHGVRFYSGAIDDTARNNVIVNSRIGLYYKATAGKRLAQNNVVVNSSSFNYSDQQGGRPIRDIGNTFAFPSYVYDPNPTNLLLKKDEDPGFCAPEYFDYRLQKDSPRLGKGAFPKWENVYFLSPSGSDSNDGGSIKKSFATFARAVKALKKGATLYVESGAYKTFKGKLEDVTVRAKGKVTVDNMDLTGSKNVVFEGFTIRQAQVGPTHSAAFRNCTFSNLAAGKNTRLYNCEVENLSGKVQFYNSLLKGKVVGSFPESPVLAGVKKVHLPQAGSAEKPHFTFYGSKVSVSWVTPDVSADHYRVKNAWWSPRPSTSYLEYGTTRQLGCKAYSSGNLFHNVELSNMTPGKKYYCRTVIPAHPFARQNAAPWRKADFTGVEKSAPQDVRSEIFTFTVPAEKVRKPREYFISPKGKDENSGSRNAPFRTIAQGAAKALPGDTVTLLPGIYYDSITPVHSGRRSSPITFRAATPGSVILDGSNFMRPGGIVCKDLEHIKFQGFIFRNYANKLYANRAGANFGMAQLFHASDIEIRDCVFSAVGTYQHPIVALDSSRIKLENCVFAKGVTAIDGSDNGDIEIRRCTFYVSEIHNIALSRQRPGSTVTVRNNLFVALTPSKALNKVERTSIKGKEFKVDFDNNCWYFSPKDKYRYCGGEGSKVKITDVAGVKRFYAKTSWGKNDIETTSIRFKGHKFIDPFEKEFSKDTIRYFTSDKNVPSLGFFEAERSDKYGVKAVK